WGAVPDHVSGHPFDLGPSRRIKAVLPSFTSKKPKCHEFLKPVVHLTAGEMGHVLDGFSRNGSDTPFSFSVQLLNDHASPVADTEFSTVMITSRCWLPHSVRGRGGINRHRLAPKAFPVLLAEVIDPVLFD